jgi:hypothetical protein
MPKVLKVSDDVYEALQILKRYPLTSLNEVIRGLIDQVCPSDFFDTDDIDRELFLENIGMYDFAKGERRLYVKNLRERRRKYEEKDLD